MPLQWDQLVRSAALCSLQSGIKFPHLGKGKQAAVLVPLILLGDEPAVLFQVRSGGLRVHAGETCFPGGKLKHGETPLAAVQREAREELGLTAWRLVGPLGTFPNRVSHYAVHALLGVVEQQAFQVDGSEIERFFTIPLRQLQHPKLVDTGRPGWPPMPVYEHGHDRVWGMTAYILHDWLTCLLSLSK